MTRTATFRASNTLSTQAPRVTMPSQGPGARPAVAHLDPPPAGVLTELTALCDKFESAADLGPELNRAIEELPAPRALLLRDLPVQSARDFSKLLHSAAASGSAADWQPVRYEPFGRPRTQIDGVDTATNIASNWVLPCHNEMAYNPRSPRRFLLMCLNPALEGGESLVMRNSDLTPLVPPELLEIVRRHGVLYTRRYFDATVGSGDGKGFIMSWQERVGGDPSRAAAEQYWLDLGFDTDGIIWGADGSLTVQNLCSGFTPGAPDGQGEWFNIINTAMRGNTAVVAGNGEPFAPELFEELASQSWRGVYAFKMRAGDLLVLDNWHFQHGRLPYVDGPEKRCLLTAMMA